MLNKNRLVASIKTARMTEEQLVHMGWSQDQIDAGMHLPGVSGGTNSTQIITDLQTVLNNISTAQQNRGSGGSPVSGVIGDTTGLVEILQLKAKEMKQIMNYILFGNINGSGSAGQAGALFLSGDSNASTTTTLLTNVNNDLV